MNNQKSAFDQKQAAAARKAEMEEITAKLEKGVQDIFEGENYREYLKFCSRFPKYSVNNQILIMLQKPDATMCQSFTGWKSMDRFVKKGETGIRIIAPSPFKVKRERDKKDFEGNTILNGDGDPVKETFEVTINSFKVTSTFDISQTQGKPVPTIGINELTGSVDGYEPLLKAIEEAVPVPISFEQIDSGAKGFYNLEDDRIVVKKDMSQIQTIKTILHEASHQALHSKKAMEKSDEKKSRNQKETEAEAVAFIVCSHFGIDTKSYSFLYLASWSKGKKVPELKASLDTIRGAASEMIEKIEEKLCKKGNTLIKLA